MWLNYLAHDEECIEIGCAELGHEAEHFLDDSQGEGPLYHWQQRLLQFTALCNIIIIIKITL